MKSVLFDNNNHDYIMFIILTTGSNYSLMADLTTLRTFADQIFLRLVGLVNMSLGLHYLGEI